MTLNSITALKYLDDIAHGRKMSYDAHELKKIVERDLEVLEILKKWVLVEETNDELFPYDISVRRAYVSSGSVLELSKEEYELLKEWLEK